MKILVGLTIFLGLFLTETCSPKNQSDAKKIMQYTIAEIENLSALKFPPDAEIVFFVEEDRGEEYAEWVIRSSAQAKFPEETWEGGSDSTIALIKSVLPNENLGAAKSSASADGIWENKTGKWQAKSVETDKRFYLLLEFFKRK